MRYRHPPGRQRILWLLCAVLLAGVPAIANAQIQKIEWYEDWGLGSVVKTGLWSPLHLRLTCVKGDFQGILEVTVDRDQQTLPVLVRPVFLAKDTPAQFWLYFRIPPSNFRDDMSGKFSWRLLDMRHR